MMVLPRRRVLKILNTDDIFIPKTVLLETEWVLRHAYEIDRSNIISGFQKLLGLSNVNVEDPDTIYQAIFGMKINLISPMSLMSAASGGSIDIRHSLHTSNQLYAMLAA